MVKFQKKGAAAPRARRTPRKNIQKQNQNASTRMSASKGKRSVGAVQIYRMPSIGLPTRLRATIGWVTGTTFIGNGTNGVANSVYFKPAIGNVLAGAVAGGVAGRCWMPAAPTDSNLGQTYMADIMKHYSRLVIHRARVCLVSLHPSTANDCTVQLAVARGAGAAPQSKANKYGNVTICPPQGVIIAFALGNRV
jgi:hypothetical protein